MRKANLTNLIFIRDNALQRYGTFLGAGKLILPSRKRFLRAKFEHPDAPILSLLLVAAGFLPFSENRAQPLYFNFIYN